MKEYLRQTVKLRLDGSSSINDTYSSDVGLDALDLAAKKAKNISFSTLGPDGTSSHLCANFVIREILGGRGDCYLFPTYEEAGADVCDGLADFLLVANAYQFINKFYISAEYDTVHFFAHDTPPYGLASSTGKIPKKDGAVIISTHPAPAHLIAKLYPNNGTSYETIFSNSTRAAAMQVSENISDICLTNTVAMRNEYLKPCSDTIVIKMPWTIFKRRSLHSV